MRATTSHDHSTHQHDSTEVVVDLEARVADWPVAPGRVLRGWTYNGQVPGPTAKTKQCQCTTGCYCGTKCPCDDTCYCPTWD